MCAVEVRVRQRESTSWGWSVLGASKQEKKSLWVVNTRRMKQWTRAVKSVALPCRYTSK